MWPRVVYVHISHTPASRVSIVNDIDVRNLNCMLLRDAKATWLHMQVAPEGVYVRVDSFAALFIFSQYAIAYFFLYGIFCRQTG